MLLLILTCSAAMQPCKHLCFLTESVKHERDSLASALNEIRHDTTRKMADMQQRFDHAYATLQGNQV